MKYRPHRNAELAVPGYQPDLLDKSQKLERAFQDAAKVTKAFTLARDVQDVVDAALRREKRND